MIKFKDLEFKKMKVQNGIQAMVDFDNGFTASIVKHDHSYGGKSGLFELAVIETSTGKITPDTDITDDVLGWQDENDIEVILDAMQHMNEKGILPINITI